LVCNNLMQRLPATAATSYLLQLPSIPPDWVSQLLCWYWCCLAHPTQTQTKQAHTSRNASTSSCGVTFDQSIGTAVQTVPLRLPLLTAHSLLLCYASCCPAAQLHRLLRAPAGALTDADTEYADATLMWLIYKDTTAVQALKSRGFC
jgi:hypothetical protein